MKIISVNDVQKLIEIVGLKSFFEQLMAALASDFSRWDAFASLHVTQHIMRRVSLN